jgi:hypothetical protein
MKAQINKSQLMKRAWNIFRGNNLYSYSFSAALRRAWEVERANIAWEAKKAAEKARLAAYHASDEYKAYKASGMSADFMTGCAAYYANARSGQYMGD